MQDLKVLIRKIEKYNSKAEVDLVKKAYNFAKESHGKQYRESGERFIRHPLQVAEVLANLELDSTTIAAALLHDVAEDTNVSLKELEEKFGRQVHLLIDGVTKLNQIKFKSKEEAQAENLRKMFVAMAEDIRVILIKLADRLHNMRTLCYLSPEKRRRIALETLEIYAPLAHRLGIFQLKWELEDLAFEVIEPKKYVQVKRMVAEGRKEREKYLDQAVLTLSQRLEAVDIKCEIVGRIKHFYSIYQKMVGRGKDFNEIYDLSAVRVLVDTIKDCYGALGIIHALWKPIPGRFKDYIAQPKFNMYQSLHTTVIGPQGRPLEIQIRTKKMHRTAEFGVAAHWRYKEGDTKADELDQLAWLRQILEWQKELKDPREFMESLKMDLFEDEVFVFTPKGDVMRLPAGATPLDFAYQIHTEVGHSCIGAKVNDSIVSLEYKLEMGDIVKILTSKTAHGPSKDWLSLVKTSRARSKIRQWLSKEVKEDSEQSGKEELQKTLRKQRITLTSAQRSRLLEEIAKEFNFKKTEDLYASMGVGKISAKQVATKIINALTKGKGEEEDTEISTLTSRKTITRVGVKVKGIDEVLVRLAHCCNPVPGDEITGFITRGRGISVHRKDCSNFKQLKKISSDRLIDVDWDVRGAGAFQVEIRVEALDREKLLRDVSSAISDCGINILSAKVNLTKDRFAIFKFIFGVSSLDHLEMVLENVKKVDAVFDAYRL